MLFISYVSVSWSCDHFDYVATNPGDFLSRWWLVNGSYYWSTIDFLSHSSASCNISFTCTFWYEQCKQLHKVRPQAGAVSRIRRWIFVRRKSAEKNSASRISRQIFICRKSAEKVQLAEY